jgi:hypothetical protein
MFYTVSHPLHTPSVHMSIGHISFSTICTARSSDITEQETHAYTGVHESESI